jgi:hypothetical protein
MGSGSELGYLWKRLRNANRSLKVRVRTTPRKALETGFHPLPATPYDRLAMERAVGGSEELRRDWSRLSDDELLGLSPRDLGLRIRGSALERPIRRLRRELADKGLGFRPHCWLSSDWFSPSGVPGIAIPFFLAHPRLRALEAAQMNAVEGGSEEECMRLLRHEAGHALDTAYRLHRRRSWRETFGPFSTPYASSYSADPASREYVHNLDNWYAQSHPAEDFAETFAAWLADDWRERYAGWAALAKLEYLDTLMREVSDRPPLVTCRERTESIGSMRQTLRRWYKRRVARYADSPGALYDDELRRVFSTPRPPELGEVRPSAADWLHDRRSELCDVVAERTGELRYTLDQVLRDMTQRCRQLDLVVDPDPAVRDQLAGSVLRSLGLLQTTRPMMSR